MRTRPKNSEAATLELYRIALSNAEAQPQIANVMSELGYDANKIQEGNNLLAITRETFDLNKTEDDETSAASALFADKKVQLEKVYRMHRRKAKVIFRDNQVMASKLSITGEVPSGYINWLETVKKFYDTANSDQEIQTMLARLAISKQQIEDALVLFDDLKQARLELLREIGESQNATKSKDEAFSKMDRWMSEFFAVARIGLEDTPQLLEAMGKIVKS